MNTERYWWGRWLRHQVMSILSEHREVLVGKVAETSGNREVLVGKVAETSGNVSFSRSS